MNVEKHITGNQARSNNAHNIVYMSRYCSRHIYMATAYGMATLSAYALFYLCPQHREVEELKPVQNDKACMRYGK